MEPGEDVQTQYFDDFPYTYIYCWKKNITISANTQTKRQPCPAYPFSLNQTWNFNTSDNIVSHSYSANSIHTDKLIETVLDVEDSHFTSPFDDEQQIWSQYDQLLLERLLFANPFSHINCHLLFIFLSFYTALFLSLPCSPPRALSSSSLLALSPRALAQTILLFLFFRFAGHPFSTCSNSY